MGFRFQRRVNLGAGFRLNLSKSGIGFSWGIPGLRIGRNARGRRTASVGVPGTGVSYRTESRGSEGQRVGPRARARERASAETRRYGIAHDRASAVFRSLDPSRFMVYFITEDDPEHRTVEQLNGLSLQLKNAFSDDRRIVGVLSGSYAYCRNYLDNLSDLFEAVFVAGPKELLERLDVEILDIGWDEGDPQLSLDAVMDS